MSSGADIVTVTAIAFDEADDLLLVTTSDGVLYEWSYETQQFVTTLNVGGSPSSIAVIPGSGVALISSITAMPSPSNGFGNNSYIDSIYRVNIATSSVTSTNFPVTGYERGVYDVAVDPHGEALVTTDFAGSGWVPFRSFDAFASGAPVFGTVTGTGLSYQIDQDTYLITSENARYTLVLEGNISDAPIHLYDAVTGTVVASTDVYRFGSSGFNNGHADVNEHANLVVDALYNNIYVLDTKLNPVKDLSSLISGSSIGSIAGAHFTFDGSHLVLLDIGKDQLRVFDTKTWVETQDIALSRDFTTADIPLQGENMVLGEQGRLLFIKTTSGFLQYDLSNYGLAPASASAAPQYGVLSGTAGDDHIVGFSGNDVITATSGVDSIDGGTGIDTLVYAGFSHDYARALSGGAGTVAGGPEAARDTLSSIENVRFLDGTLSFDAGSTAAQIVRLYDSFLGRAPDAAGFESYLRFVGAGHSFQDMAANAAASPEFAAATAGLSDTQYVTYVYEHSLHREPDAGGLATYVADLHNGTFTRTSLLVQAAESPEHVALTAPLVAAGLWIPDETVEGIELLYDAAVQRQPDASGLAGYGSLLAGGTSLRQVAGQIAGSAEFAAHHAGQSDAQYVDSLYLAEVGRHADAYGLAAYTDQLAHGATRGDILYETAISLEHQSMSWPTPTPCSSAEPPGLRGGDSALCASPSTARVRVPPPLSLSVVKHSAGLARNAYVFDLHAQPARPQLSRRRSASHLATRLATCG